MDALTPDLELRLRTELAERRVAELTAALENMKGERDSWRTIAECRLLPGGLRAPLRGARRGNGGGGSLRSRDYRPRAVAPARLSSK